MDIKQYVADEMAKYNGVSFPVKSSLLRRMLVKQEKCSNLHPNPDDEFCDPAIGPSLRIISEYERKIRRSVEFYDNTEPLIVERMYPEGYMIINGHHRWAAYMRAGEPMIKISVVNLTHEADIKKMLEKTDHSKRVTFDLDEVVFGKEGEEELERKLHFLNGKIYKERIRSGIPALFNHFSKHGYDIWVYTSNFYSMDYLKRLFKKYHVKVDGLVTGTAKRSKEASSRIDSMFAEKYKTTVHVDRLVVLKTISGSKDFEEKEINTETSNWSREVMKIIDEIEKPVEA